MNKCEFCTASKTRMDDSCALDGRFMIVKGQLKRWLKSWKSKLPAVTRRITI